VYPVTEKTVRSVTVSGTRCPINDMVTVKATGNKRIVDVSFAIDYTCVTSSDAHGWKLRIEFPGGFTPMCCASKQSDFQYLALLLKDVGVIAVDVTPISFTLIWDIPGPCSVEVVCAETLTRNVQGQVHKMEVVNVEPGRVHSVRVQSENQKELPESYKLEVDVPHRTVTLMHDFLRSRHLPDQTYDLTSVSENSIAYLRRNKIIKSGYKLRLCPKDRGKLDLTVATCGDTVELSSGNNIYVVPEFEDNASQYICLQQRLRNFMLEFDRSESFVKYNGSVYPHGSRFSLDKQCVEVVRGSIILLVTDSDAITPVAFPGGNTEATAVQNSGDVVIRDLVMRDVYQVTEKVAGETTYLRNSFYIYDSTNNSTTECSRVSLGLNDAKDMGSVSIDVLDSSGLKNTFETTPAQTSISCTDSTGDTTATFASTGLHFDSDKGDIYFGADKDFRIHFADVDGLDPAMLQIQSLSGGEYITRFLITSEL